MHVEYFKHNLGNDEINECIKALKSLNLTTGIYVDEFEKLLSRYLKIKYSVGLTSCTAALQLGLLAANVQEGDEVITTPMSFVATANSICMVGAKPIFVDVEEETGNINVNLIEKHITKKTKAIMPVHLYGQMIDMKHIIKISKKYDIPVIEDAAHALEAERDGIKPGQQSFGSCLSFYATKSITSAEGGAFVTNNKNVARLVKKLRSHGITSELAQRDRKGIKKYDVDVLGWKYNMDNIQASLLVNQVPKINKNWKRRDEIAKLYKKQLKINGLDLPLEYDNSRHGRHIFPIWVNPKKRDEVLSLVNSNGVGATINYPSINLFTYYKKKYGLKKGMFPKSERIGLSEISLPLYSRLTDLEIEYVVQTVKKAINHVA
jgi:dTDP-4-amino-4,6-dideoxygalactose transaminase